MFATSAWLRCWLDAFGRGEPAWLLLRKDTEDLRGGALLERHADGSLRAAANVHSGDWDVLGEGEHVRSALWGAVAELGARSVHLHGIPDQDGRPEVACERLRAAGYRVVRQPGPTSPWLPLPDSFDALLAGVSRGLRSQVGRRRRALERAGSLRLRVVTGGPELEGALESFLALEASGWKGRAGTAILSRSDTRRLYREFALAAAQQGWLRLYLLELDGQPVAGDYGCAFAGTGYLLKTTFSEAHGRLSPGLVLRAAVLEASIAEGLRAYNFLGEAEGYKTRWTDGVQRHASIWGYRSALHPGYTYYGAVRPRLKAARNRMRALRGARH